jgi:protein TonB
MKRTLLITLFILPVLMARAQQQPAQKQKDRNAEVIIDSPIPMDTSKTVPYDPDRIFTSVEQIPTFAGGMDRFYRYLGQNIRCPANAVKNHIQGKVIVTFVIEKDGSLNEIRVARGVSEDIDAEAIRVVKNSPKWVPGLQNGKPVRVQYTVPVSFSLSTK